jgi:pilus assembly protein CpaC
MVQHMCLRAVRAATGLIGAVLVFGMAADAAADTKPLYVEKDKSELVTIRTEPLTKVSVTNPAIADVLVITPTELLVSGKAVGVTSLVLFYRGRVDRLDIVVQPQPSAPVLVPLVHDAPHSVVVQRGSKASRQLFVPDTGKAWVELGGAEPDGEASKK